MTFFVEQHGYFMDQELLAASAGYVRDSFVMASLDQLSEYEHLERILLDAVQSAPIHYDVETLCNSISPSSDRYSKYQREPYKPLPHYKRETWRTQTVISHDSLRSPFLFILLEPIGVIGVLAPVKLDLHNQIRCLLDRYRTILP